MRPWRQWIIGLLFSLLIGQLVVWLFLKWLQRWLGKTPSDKGGKHVPAWITGGVERIFFTVLVGLDALAVPALMLGWLGLKMATNWNSPVFKDPEMRPFAIRALLAGLVSMLFAFLGGLLCAGKLPS
jgi:hypothetical protein